MDGAASTLLNPVVQDVFHPEQEGDSYDSTNPPAMGPSISLLSPDREDLNAPLPDYISSDDDNSRSGENITNNQQSPGRLPTDNPADGDNIPSQVQELLDLGDAHAPIGYVFGVQEPAIYCDTVINMGSAEAIFDRSIPPDQVRAALIFNPQLNMWEDKDFCDRDMATALWTGTQPGDVYVTSLYCDIDLPAVPNKLNK